MSQVTRSFTVIAQRTTLNDKGQVTGKTVMEGFPRIQNATSASQAEALTSMRIAVDSGEVFSAGATEDGAAVSLNEGAYLNLLRDVSISVEQV